MISIGLKMCQLKTKKLSENSQKLLNIWTIKKFYCLLVRMYKMVHIGKETYENNDIEVIVHGISTLRLNEKHIEEKLGDKNLLVIKNKYDQVYKKHRYELVDKSKQQPNRRFLCSDLALKVIMDCRTDESCNLKRNLGFRLHNVINTEEQTIINSIKDVFEGEVCKLNTGF